MLLNPHLAWLLTAAWRRPFLDPLPVDDYWLWLLVPLVAAICVVYKTIKADRPENIPRQSLNLMVQFMAMMALAAVALWLLSEVA
jgi:hypothetical protein